MEQGFKNMENAVSNGDWIFQNGLIHHAGITRPEAAAVQTRWLKEGFAKRDQSSGEILIVHVGLLNKEVIQRALKSAAADQSE